MPRVTLAGHPLHPQLVGLPIGLIPFSLAMDILYAVTDREDYARAAKYAMVGATIGAVASAVAGVLDYLTIPSRTREKQLGNTHAALNTGVLLLTMAGLAMREDSIPRSKASAVAIGALANIGLVVSQWYGGDLVYEHGVRVRGRQERAESEEWKPPRDSGLARAASRIADSMTDRGPDERAA